MHDVRAARHVSRVIFGQCPSCRRLTPFRFLGQQMTPPTLWQEMGRKVNLYNCGNCGTTVLERRITHQRRFRCIDGILHRRQLVRRVNNQDTYKWVPVDRSPHRNHGRHTTTSK